MGAPQRNRGGRGVDGLGSGCLGFRGLRFRVQGLGSESFFRGSGFFLLVLGLSCRVWSSGFGA